MLLGATEGDFIDICIVHGMLCVVSERFFLAIYVVRGCFEGDFLDIYVVRGMFCVTREGFYSLFPSRADAFRSHRRPVANS